MTDISNMEDIAVLKADIDAKLQKVNNSSSDDTKWFTLLTPSFGNHLFANYHVLKHPLTNLILSSVYIPKVLKSVAKIIEIGSQIKI